MLYKDFKECKLSALGLGTMRLPTVGEEPGSAIDEEKAGEMVEYALQHGINYFDTAYGYHNGQSEPVMGKLLSKYPRDSYYLASKFPGYDLANMNKVEEIFEEQLQRCGVEYFDFYLFHNVYEKNIDAYLDPQYGILEYLLKQKEAGRIRHLGFSAHGRCDNMERFLKAYGEHMEFCQIQLNYLDWKLQRAQEKMELLKRYEIPVWVMEPLRGGRLAALDDVYEEKLKALRPEEEIPAWGFRFLQSLDGIKMVLSGMSNMEQLKANIQTFSQEKPLKEEEWKALMEIADTMLNILPCTACRYCVSNCPQGLDIPVLLLTYNEAKFAKGFVPQSVVESLGKDKTPDNCIACQSCEAVCPQQIKISEAMAAFAELIQHQKES